MMDGWHIDKELFHAVFGGDVDKATCMLQMGSNVNARSFSGHSVIHNAVINNQVRMVQHLTNCGVDVNLMLEHLMAPLHVTARYSCDAVAKLLLEHGADPNTASEWGSPLAVAVNCNNISVALMLIKGGATVSTQCLCQRRRADHSIMLLRAKLHILAK